MIETREEENFEGEKEEMEGNREKLRKRG
jgi:hypothetical protein